MFNFQAWCGLCECVSMQASCHDRFSDALQRQDATRTGEKFFSMPGACWLRSGKTLGWQMQQGLQLRPVKSWPRVLFAAWRHMFVTGDVGDRVAPDQCLAQSGEALVLGRLKPFALQAVEFNADGVVVAVVASAVMGTTGVPRAVVTADELPKFTVSTDIEVRRHLHRH